MLPEIPDQITLLREANVKLFGQVKVLEAQHAQDTKEIKEWSDFNFKLVEELAKFKSVAKEVNLDALSEQFANVLCMDEGEDSPIAHVSTMQARQFADEFEKRAIEEKEKERDFRAARMYAQEVIGTVHILSASCSLTKSILNTRGWDVIVRLEGIGESRAMLVLIHQEDD